MLKILFVVIAQLSTYAAILDLYLNVMPLNVSRPRWHWELLGAVFAVALIGIFVDVRQALTSQPKVFRNTRDINKYMCRWISSDGRAVVFSRDMSWGKDMKVREILLRKAMSHELTIYLEHETELTNELKKAGATIVTYSSSNQSPRSRFTIVGYGKDGARVAVGIPYKGKHIIQEYESGVHPFFAVSEDMTKFIAAYESGHEKNA